MGTPPLYFRGKTQGRSTQWGGVGSYPRTSGAHVGTYGPCVLDKTLCIIQRTSGASLLYSYLRYVYDGLKGRWSPTLQLRELSFSGDDFFDVVEFVEGFDGGEVVDIGVEYFVANLREYGVVELEEAELHAAAGGC